LTVGLSKMLLARWKVAIWITAIIGVAAATTGIVIHIRKTHRVTLQGVVIRQDSDPNKQSPIANVEITALTGSTTSNAKSDPSGFFSVTLPREFRRHQSVILHFRHPDYRPLELNELVEYKLYVVHLQPVSIPQPAVPDHPDITVSNVRVRYSAKTTGEQEVGSTVKTFQVVNTGNVPCRGQHPCSPDGKWKAAIGTTSLDAGEGNEFRNARATCLAGPCPFARIEYENLSRDGRMLNVAARDWSDTVTFVLEAEVVHPMVSDLVRESFPVIFGRTLSFTLPASVEGPSIEAEVNGAPIVFPLGPDLFLSWAQCTLEVSRELNKVYRCELKPGYRFK
jgi:hypothetical protein